MKQNSNLTLCLIQAIFHLGSCSLPNKLNINYVLYNKRNVSRETFLIVNMVVSLSDLFIITLMYMDCYIN